MNLCEGRICKQRAPFVSTVRRRDVASSRVGRKIKDVSVSPSGDYDSIRRVPFDFSGAQIPSDDSLGMSLDNHEVEHLRLRKHLHCADSDLTTKRLITSQQELLTSLSTRIKSPRHLRAAEGTIGKIAAVFARKRHTLRDALVDNVVGDLSEPIDVRFAGTKIAALNGVVKEAVNAVAVVLVIFRRVDPALRCNRMRAARRILKAKTFHPITQFAQCRCS